MAQNMRPSRCCRTDDLVDQEEGSVIEKKIHLVFSIVMSLFMIGIMSFVVTYLNIGWNEETIDKWLSSFFVAWVVGFPLLYFFGPVFRKVITRILAR